MFLPTLQKLCNKNIVLTQIWKSVGVFVKTHKLLSVSFKTCLYGRILSVSLFLSLVWVKCTMLLFLKRKWILDNMLPPFNWNSEFALLFLLLIVITHTLHTYTHVLDVPSLFGREKTKRNDLHCFIHLTSEKEILKCGSRNATLLINDVMHYNFIYIKLRNK